MTTAGVLWIAYFSPFIISTFAIAYFLHSAGRSWGNALFGGLFFSCVALVIFYGLIAVIVSYAGKEALENLPYWQKAALLGLPPLSLAWLWYRAYRQSKE